jgi:hypothetical protein
VPNTVCPGEAEEFGAKINEWTKYNINNVWAIFLVYT